MSLPSFYRGDTLNYSFNFEDASQVAIDISNMTLWFTMKLNSDDPDASAVLQDSVTFPVDANSAAGIGSLTVAAADTADLEPGTTYYYDFQLVDGTTITTLGSGTVSVLRDITISTS